MDRLLQIDWLAAYVDEGPYFLNEEELDNSVTERILRNQFRDPMLDYESDEENHLIDWNKIFANAHKKTIEEQSKYVPGVRRLPPFPKLSALTAEQQFQCLKVMCARSPNILDKDCIAEPSKNDFKVFEDLLLTYTQEQKEFMEWAKHLWTTDHCIRALRPKPLVETTYDAEFNIKAKEMKSFPKSYIMAAQIPLETRNVQFEMICEKELIGVDITELPEITNPQPITKKFSIMTPCTLPEPCMRHQCRFVLPNESSITQLPLNEVHKVLAQYALDNGVELIANEKALKCLIELDRSWTINLSVCEAITANGGKRSVLVLGGEVMVRKEPAQTRSYRALRHLLEHSLVSTEEKLKFRYKSTEAGNEAAGPSRPMPEPDNAIQESVSGSSDDEDFNLFIADEAQRDSNSDTGQIPVDELVAKLKACPQNSKAMLKKKSEFYQCTCEGTLYERPPPRSFKKWRLRNLDTQERYGVIIHCSHKLRDKQGEILLEPIPEYQLDLAVSQVSEEKNKSLALSLNLRTKASLMMVRVDGSTGEVVLTKEVNYDQHAVEHGESMSDIAQTISTALEQLRHLKPGHYLLRHEVSHGCNALLYAAGSGYGDSLKLDFSPAPRADIDESLGAKTPPKLEPTLLPWHLYRKIMPCAFTPYEKQVVKDTKKPPAKQRQPPAAIALEAEAGSGAKVKWHKKGRGKKEKRNT